MTITEKKLKRHNLAINEDLYRKLEEMAERRGTSVTELIRTCLKIGLVALEMENAGADLLVRRGDKEERLLIVS